jgi:hypothetical protein
MRHCDSQRVPKFTPLRRRVGVLVPLVVCAAQPAGKVLEEKRPSQHWLNLIGPNNLRDAGFILRFPDHCLHSSYAELVPLLQSMLMHLRGDLQFCEGRGKKGKPPYMREGFQRLVLDFLVTNKTNGS